MNDPTGMAVTTVSGKSAVSPDGSYVAIVSTLPFAEEDRILGSQNYIYLFDVKKKTALLVSRIPTENPTQNFFENTYPTFSPDGQKLLFLSSSRDFASQDNDLFADAFIYDMQSGFVQIVSVNEGGETADNHVYRAYFLSNTEVLMLTTANNLATNDYPSNDVKLYLKNISTGAVRLITINGEADDIFSIGIREEAIATDAGKLVFTTRRRKIYPKTLLSDDLSEVYIYDFATDQVSSIVTAVDGMPASNTSLNPIISTDGRFVAFTGMSDDLIDGDNNANEDIFVKDLNNGDIRRVSENYLGEQIPRPFSTYPGAFSLDGKRLAFWHRAQLIGQHLHPDLTAPINPANPAVLYVIDLETDELDIASRDYDGTPLSFPSNYLREISWTSLGIVTMRSVFFDDQEF